MQNLVWLTSYPKSGNTWVRAFLTAYLLDLREPVDLKQMEQFTTSESYFQDFVAVSGRPREQLSEDEIDSLRESVQQRLAANNPHRGWVKTHNMRTIRNGSPLICSQYTRLAIYVARNPLDIVDSLADHTNLTLNQTIALLNDAGHYLGTPDSDLVGQYPGTWSQHVTSWTAPAEFPVHVVRYEDLQVSPGEVFGKLIEFWGWEFDEDRVQRAVNNSSFSSLRNSEARVGFAESSPLTRSGRFFRRGKSGAWRDILSRRQAETVITHHAVQMRALGYGVPDLDMLSGTD